MSHGGFNPRKFCNKCLAINRAKILIGNKTADNILVINQTKRSLYDKRSGWQSANSAIRSHARKVYFSSELPKSCKICGYNLHIEICHIKQVSDFADDSLILEINNINNLIALCPNHHWEFDNGLIAKD